MPSIPAFMKAASAVLASIAALLLPMAAGAQAQIRNTAALTYASDAGERTVVSNTVELTRGKLPTSIWFKRLPTDFVIDHSVLRCDPNTLTFTPQPIGAADLAKAQPLMSYDIDNPVVVVLVSEGSNRDPNKIETARLDADSGKRTGKWVLTETGVNTGVFAAVVPPSTRYLPEPVVCDTTADNSNWFTLSFTEDADSYASSTTILIDPLGHVFDSQTGKPIDGATVTLIDDATGKPATQVFGDDGISAYPNQVVTGHDVTDAGGWIYRMQDGDFRFPLLPPGRYRLVVTPPPGYTSPSIATPEQIAPLRNPHGLPFTIVDASYGAPFVLSNPDPVTIDLPIDPIAVLVTKAIEPKLVVTKSASLREAEMGDLVQYRVTIRNTGTDAAAPVEVTDILPRGLRYRLGTTRGSAEPVAAADGRTLRFTLPRLAINAEAQLSYVVEIAPGAPAGEAVNHVTASAPTQTGRVSAAASAPVRIRSPLMTDAFTVIGRVTEGDCRDPERGRKGVGGIRLLMEDGSYVVTDADGFYHFEGVEPGTHVVQIDLASVPATHEPVACDADTRAGGSALSRFVEAGGGSLQRVDFQLKPTGKAAVAADALPVTVAEDAAAAGNREDWLAQAEPGMGWLFPAIDHNPRAPAVRVVIRHAPGQSIALTLGGKPVDPLSYDGGDSDHARGVAISRWTGLPLIEGDNKLEARVIDASGAVVATLERSVHYANTPARAVYAAEKSRLVADGLTRPLVAVRVLDRAGRPVRAGASVAFVVDQPYQAAQASAAQQGRQLAGLERTQATAQVVGDEGLAFVALQPTRQPGLARIRIAIADPESGRETVSEIKAWLAAPAQDWVIVGYGKGTLGYDALKGAERLERGKKHEVVTDGRLSLYAKGRIKGSWLLTLAYDSDKDLQRMRERGVLSAIDPDRYYTVYGDGTLQGHDAASRRKLYLRLERREFYALYGDFETGLVDTRLGRYSRTMSGVKAEYTGRVLRFTAFAANDDNRYGRDEIQGNGLSGPYRLSARDLVPGSDKLRIETRDRLRSERIVESRELTRHIDYDIDSLAGTVRFREPVLSRDAEGNPNFIVADYESWGAGRKLAAGGRAAVTLGKVEIGASVVHDEGVARAATVAIADARVKFSQATEARAEVAMGGRDGVKSGSAWLAEVEHHGTTVDVLAYARQQDREFGLGQQNAGEAGARKIGADGRVRISDKWSIAGSAWHQQDLDGAASRVAGDLRVELRRKTGTIHAGVQMASDRTPGGDDRDSRLLSLGATQQLLGNKLELSGEAQLPLGGKDDSVDFPARQRLGAAWRFSESVKLIAGYEIAEGEKFKAQAVRLGFDVAPWSGGRVTASANRGGIAENGARTYAQYGLAQSLPLGKSWTIDATVDSSTTFAGSIPKSDVVNQFHPVATGGFLGSDGIDGDFTAITLGATYRGERWSWNGRGEFRTGPREQRWGMNSNLLRQLGGGSTLASSVRAYRLREASGSVASSVRGELALAVRPIDSRWSLLERFQLRHESAGGNLSANNALAVPVFASDTLTTLRAVNNLAVNYRVGDEGNGHAFEASFYYGAKYVRGRYAGEGFDGFVDVLGLEIRKDVTRNFDLGAQGSMQHSWSSGAKNLSLGVSAGVSPGKNLWLSAGYNFTGYRDRDFEESRWTRQGPYLTLRMKFDQQSLGEMVRPLVGGGK